MDTLQNIVHFDIGLSPFHITYRLHGSIPQSEIDRIRKERNAANIQSRAWLETLPARFAGDAYRKEAERLSRLHEEETEKALHRHLGGPWFLQRTDIRSEVLSGWQFLNDRGEIDLHAVCVMSNHVHAIFSLHANAHPHTTANIMGRHKSFTAGRCNKLLGRTGTPFWAANYFDRTIRRDAWLPTMWYVVNNPVKAGLVSHWREWPGTWVAPRFVCHFVQN
jgi:REP element-mobilizing transposase RayT